MKKLSYIVLLIVSMSIVACEYDNYDAPGTRFEGNIVYNGEALNVEKSNDQNPNNAVVYFELWEAGWQNRVPIRVIVDQDGSYSALLFNADYKLVIPKGQGPFMSRINDETASDTILLPLRGNKELNIEVTPYYMVRSPQFSHESGKVKANFRLEKIIQDVNAKNIEQVFLSINKTTFVDGSSQIRRADLDGASIVDMNDINLEVDIPAIVPSQNYVYARIGVKIAGVDDLLFSPVQKIEF
jgi:hypothetical protein